MAYWGSYCARELLNVAPKPLVQLPSSQGLQGWLDRCWGHQMEVLVCYGARGSVYLHLFPKE